MKARIALFLFFMFCGISNLLGFSTDRDKFIETPLFSTGQGPLFFLDYTNLLGIDGQTYVEFYIQVGYDELQFVKDKNQGNFSAGYDIDLLIFNQNSQLVESYTTLDKFHVDSYKDTQLKDKARVALIGFTFNPGQYRIKVLVTDLETQKTSKIDNLFEARNFQSNELMISDIQFSQKIKPAEPGSPYVKNQRYVEPMAARTFAPQYSNFFIYFEIYNLLYEKHNNKLTYTTYFIFHNNKGEKIAQFHRRKIKPGETSAHSLKIPLDTFLSGKYILTVRVRDDITGQIAESSKSFTVLDIPISQNIVTPDDILY